MPDNLTEAQTSDLERRARQGNAEAQVELGLAWHQLTHFDAVVYIGHFTSRRMPELEAKSRAKKDLETDRKALALFQQAANQGYPRGQYNFAFILQTGGVGFPKNEPMAVTYLTLIAASKNADANLRKDAKSLLTQMLAKGIEGGTIALTSMAKTASQERINYKQLQEHANRAHEPLVAALAATQQQGRAR